ncbi:hypothetical protein NYV38_03245 [Escherichia coli]|nr:hypothetical protein [Escherichia coli]
MTRCIARFALFQVLPSFTSARMASNCQPGIIRALLHLLKIKGRISLRRALHISSGLIGSMDLANPCGNQAASNATGRQTLRLCKWRENLRCTLKIMCNPVDIFTANAQYV